MGNLPGEPGHELILYPQSHLVQEDLDERRMYQQRIDKPENSSVEMGIMIDVLIAFTCHIL